MGADLNRCTEGEPGKRGRRGKELGRRWAACRSTTFLVTLNIQPSLLMTSLLEPLGSGQKSAKSLRSASGDHEVYKLGKALDLQATELGSEAMGGGVRSRGPCLTPGVYGGTEFQPQCFYIPAAGPGHLTALDFEPLPVSTTHHLHPKTERENLREHRDLK